MEPNTLRYLMAASRRLEDTRDRAFMLAGYYPLTHGTIGPVCNNHQRNYSAAKITNNSMPIKYRAFLLTIIFTVNYLK